VKEGHYISDEPEWRCFEEDCDDKSRVHVLEDDPSGYQKKASYIYKDILHHFDEVMVPIIDEIYMELQDTFPKNKKKSLPVICYMVSKLLWRPFTCENICYMLQMEYDTHDFWSMHTIAMQRLKDVNEKRYRQLLDCAKMHSDVTAIVRRLGEKHPLTIPEHKIIRVANDIYTKVVDKHACKMSKMCVSIVYVACQALRGSVSKKVFSDIFAISESTMKKHEQIIQSILTD